MEAVSTAVVDLVGNSSTHLKKASMITKIYSLPFASLVSGPIWSRWGTSNGLYEAQVNRWALICSHIRLITWHAGHCRMISVIYDIYISPGRWCASRSRRLQITNPQWATLELWTLDNLAWMSGGNTMTGRRVTMRRSAEVGGGGMWFVHNRDKASGTIWCSSLPETLNKSKSLSCKYIFHRKTLSVNVTLIYSYDQSLGWSRYCLIDLKIALHHNRCHSTLSPWSAGSTEIRWEICWRIERRGLVH